MIRTLPILLFVLAVPIARADDSHVIKLKLDPDKGKTVSYHSISTGTGSMKGFDADGKLAFEWQREGDELGLRETVLEEDKDGKATRVLRIYEKATEKANGKTTAFSYQGRTVLFEKTGEKFRLGVAGDPPLDPKDVATLLKRINRRTDSETMFRNLAPEKPVNEGDSWSVPVKPIAEAMDGMTIDEAKSSVSAKLVKVYAKGQSKFGTIHVGLKLIVTKMSEDGMNVAFDPPAVMEITNRIDTPIDGSSTERTGTGTISLKGEGPVTVGGMTLRLVFDMQASGRDHVSAEVYDPKAHTVPKVTFAADPNEWTEIKSKDGSFKVEFPGTPIGSGRKGNGYTETRWIAQTDHGRITYGVAITEFADPSKTDPKAAIKRFVSSAKGVKGQKDIEVNGFAGVEVVYEQETKGIAVAITRRILNVNGRIFEVMIATLNGNTGEPEKFFKSFQILERPKGKGD